MDSDLEKLLDEEIPRAEQLAAAGQLFGESAIRAMPEDEALRLGVNIWSDRWVFEVGYELMQSADRYGEAKPMSEERIWRREHDPYWFPVLTVVHFATDEERAALRERVMQ